MAGKLSGGAIQSGTISTTQISSALNTTISAGGGPKISTIIYPDDDTAANTNGGQTLYITGSGFKTNSTVFINGNNVPSVSYISASNLSFTGPALSSATYPVYVINPEDGATAILIPGLQVSGEPTWVTGATLTEQDATGTFNISLSATGDAPLTYALAAGSSLPGGITLASNGTISGTITTPPETDTTYNFTVNAIDAQNQSSSRAFSVTATTGEGLLFANNVLLIHADGTNNGNNHSFLDSSNNNFTITRFGNTSQGSFSPFSQTGWSAYFDGSGDYLSCSANAGFNIVSGDFTAECWIYDQGSGAERYLFSNRGAVPTSGWELRKNATNLIQFFFTGGSSLTSTTTITSNKWTHVAVTRSGNTVRIFLDGVLDASSTFSDGASGAAEPFYLGYGTTGGGYFLGYISNARIVKGTALYTTTFTPPTSPLTAVSNTSLLTCQSNRIVDEGPNNLTLTRNGDVSIQPFSPFVSGLLSSNSHSVFFDGTGDYLNTSNNAAFTFGTGDLTLECWIYQTATSTSTYRVIFGDNVYGSTGGYTLYSYNNALNLWKGSGGGGAEVIAPAGTIPLNAWTHVAWTRSGSSNRLFINGTQVGATTTDSTNYTSTASFIGANQIGQLPFAGYISNVRILKGTAQYTSNFTPSTAPLTAVSNTSLLTCQSATLIDNSTNAFTITRNGDVRPRRFNPFGQTYTGTVYATANVGGSAYFDGTGDYLSIADDVALDAFTDFTIEGWVYFNSAADSQVIVSKGWDAASTFSPYILYTSSGGLVFTASADGSSWGVLNASVIPNITVGRWYHFAVTRSGSTIRYFNNGALTGTSTLSAALMNSTHALTIGSHRTGGYYLNGYLSGLRIVKGTALYTNPFVPPSAPVTNIANTSALLNFTNAQIFDQTAKNVLETVGDAKVSTTQYKYGAASMYFDGNGDYCRIPYSNLLQLPGNFTIECWVYPISRVVLYPTIIHNYSTYTTNGGFGIFAGHNSATTTKYQISFNGSFPVIQSSNNITYNAWSHIAFTRSGSTLTLYVNGVNEGTNTSTAIVNGTQNFYWIGASGDELANSYFNGYIDDVRITKGSARYTANFTAPTAKFKDK